MDGQLSFKEFLSLILPLSNSQVRANAVARENYTVGQNDTLPHTVEYTLAQLIHKETLLHSNVGREMRELFNCYDYNVQAAFKLIDTTHTRCITFDSLSKYLKKMKAGAQASDVVAFMRRMDRDLDCKVSFKEFFEAFHAPTARRIKPSYITPTKAFQANVSRSVSFNGKKPLQKYKNSIIKHTSTPAKSTNNKSGKKLNNPKRFANASLLSPYQRELIRSYSVIGKRSDRRTLSASKKPVTPLKPKKSISTNSTTTSKPTPSIKKVKLKKPAIFVLLKQQLRVEERLELLKQSLVLCKDLTLANLWTLLNPKNKVCIQPEDLARSLKTMDVSEDEEGTFLLFSRFDWDMDGVWRMSDVEKVVAPVEKDYEEIIAAKVERCGSVKMRKETVGLVKRLLKEYIKGELENEKCKKLAESVDERQAFNQFDTKNVDFFTLPEVVHV